jgi:D-inositol-3-phosphate glycosyltransferase
VRIALVSEHASPLAVLGGEDAGGQNVHVAALARALGRRGHVVDVYTRREDPATPETVSFGPGVEVVHVPAGPPRPVPKDELAPYMPEFGDWLTRRWRGTAPDLVHAHFWMSGLAALVASRAHGVPLVQTFHALGTVKRRHQRDADTSPPERLAAEARLAATVDTVIATCSDEVRELRTIGGRPAHTVVVPCGVDVRRFNPAVPPAPSLPPRRERYRLVSVGRLVERKGLAEVIRAVAAVPDTELVVAGGPPASELNADPRSRRLLDLAAERGVADRVRLLGRVGHDRLAGLYRSADLVVSVPWYEPFGIVPLEAMACGVPVVASAVGGMLDTVIDGRTGLHVRPRDETALAAALRALLPDARTRAAMGRAGRHRAVQRYQWDRVAQDTEAVYRGLVTRSRPLALTQSHHTGRIPVGGVAG